ncbi:MAG: anti-sigma regulatory factor [Desulfarculus sp.]|nr:anti-sigma regulatory factor [Desulfarculus sp.]
MTPPQDQEPEFLHAFTIAANDFAGAGQVSIAVKNLLKEVGFSAQCLRRVAIVAFEAEMNVVMYGGGGGLSVYLAPTLVRLVVEDQGPGIPDLDLAMQEGWSTATPEMREMGFGAGMGLPNIKRNSDRLEIHTSPGRGTKLVAEIILT